METASHVLGALILAGAANISLFLIKRWESKLIRAVAIYFMSVVAAFTILMGIDFYNAVNDVDIDRNVRALIARTFQVAPMLYLNYVLIYGHFKNGKK